MMMWVPSPSVLRMLNTIGSVVWRLSINVNWRWGPGGISIGVGVQSRVEPHYNVGRSDRSTRPIQGITQIRRLLPV